MAGNTPFEITDDATPQVKAIYEHVHAADNLLKKMENEVAQMVGVNWAGNQAQAFHARMTEHLDSMTHIQVQTNNLADSSMHYITAHQNLDA
jgi:hypothetical protein